MTLQEMKFFGMGTEPFSGVVWLRGRPLSGIRREHLFGWVKLFISFSWVVN